MVWRVSQVTRGLRSVLRHGNVYDKGDESYGTGSEKKKLDYLRKFWVYLTVEEVLRKRKGGGGVHSH